MTNLEWIRTLSSKEMQRFLAVKSDCTICFFNNIKCWELKSNHRCMEGMIKWLESEHKDYEDDDEYDED